MKMDVTIEFTVNAPLHFDGEKGLWWGREKWMVDYANHLTDMNGWIGPALGTPGVFAGNELARTLSGAVRVTVDPEYLDAVDEVAGVY